MAFSQGTGLGPIIGIVALFVVVGLLVTIGRADSPIYPCGRRPDHRWGDRQPASTGCSATPGWLRGAVIDFIDVQWWPIFNVADIAVTIGGVLLVLSTLRQPATHDRAGRERE